MALNFPPRKDNPRFDDWMLLFWRQVTNGGEAFTDHAQLSNLNSENYTHLTNANAALLTGGGNTSLHYHASDRDRANHTGTQLASTISDFAAAVEAVQGSSVLEAQIFGG